MDGISTWYYSRRRTPSKTLNLQSGQSPKQRDGPITSQYNVLMASSFSSDQTSCDFLRSVVILQTLLLSQELIAVRYPKSDFPALSCTGKRRKKIYCVAVIIETNLDYSPSHISNWEE
jgi:hypothetical protein